jgi:hypothetical protein
MGVLEAVFIQALYLSLGALLTDVTSRHVFDENVKKLSGFVNIPNAHERLKKQNLKYIPSDEPTWYDYYLDFNTLEWISWKKAIPEYIHNDTITFNDILVPTVESTRLVWILKLINEVFIQYSSLIFIKYMTVLYSIHTHDTNNIFYLFQYYFRSAIFKKVNICYNIFYFLHIVYINLFYRLNALQL